jgi:cyclophilin family peptidyl-prolyl cis-trans isomerase
MGMREASREKTVGMKNAVVFCVAAGMALSAAGAIARNESMHTDRADRKLPKVVAQHADQEIAVMRLRLDGRSRTVGIILLRENAPKTCENFISKAREGFYNGLAFHRAIEGFLVQSGDPLSREDSSRGEWGTGGPGHTIPAEHAGDHAKGAVAMARVKPGGPAHGSQFYISMDANSALDGQSTVFGQVIRGMDVLEDLSKVAVDANDNPVVPVRIESLRILEPGSPIFKTADEIELEEEFSRARRRAKRPSVGQQESWLSSFLGRYW